MLRKADLNFLYTIIHTGIWSEGLCSSS